MQVQSQRQTRVKKGQKGDEANDEVNILWTESKVIIQVRAKACHIDRVQGSGPLAQGDVGRCIVMFESFVRSENMWSEERSVLVIWSVAISADPWPILPESGVQLLISEQIVVVGMRVWTMDGELIWRLES